MSQKDAKFEDGLEQPIAVKALDNEDIVVISSLVQDAVLPSKEISWLPKENRFGMLVNRFRWENRTLEAERVQAVLVFDCVLDVKSSGVDSSQKDQVLSVLALEFRPNEGGGGEIAITLAGDGEIALTVECIDITLKDATRPYIAPSKSVPTHNLD